MFIDKLTPYEKRLPKGEIVKLLKEKLSPWMYTKETLLDILNYERLTPDDFVKLGRNPDGSMSICSTCKTEYGHPDNCIGCPKEREV